MNMGVSRVEKRCNIPVYRNRDHCVCNFATSKQSKTQKTSEMKRLILALIIGLVSAVTVNAQYNYGGLYGNSSYSSKQNASITFRNQSDYTMTLRILYAGGGYYSTVSLRPHTSSKVSFSKSGNFKLKIKAASSYGQVSYHDGGKFSVTCTSSEWTEGEISFQLSSYGSGLGPSISAKQFESNY